MNSRLLASAMLVCALGVSAKGGTVSYNFELSPGTVNGLAITDIMILERGQGQIQLDKTFSLPAFGLANLTHEVSFVPESSLILGVNPSDGTGDGKPHLIMFVNSAFAASASGRKFSDSFPNTRHSAVVDNLLLAVANDAAAKSWLEDFFANGDGALASFKTGGSFGIMEFSNGFPIGNAVPEPSSLVLLGIGGIALAMRWRRAANRRD